jgi:electron transport complex protein RnfC
MPRILCLLLKQHVGSAAEPVVTSGKRVKKGDLLARAHGPVSAPIHAPTSGSIVDIIEQTAPHPSGLPQKAIQLRPDGKDQWGILPAGLEDPFSASPAEIDARVAAAGIVGLGGAAFPSAVKLGLRETHTLDTLILNGAECEPYLTCDDRVMREYAAQVVDGARILAHGLTLSRVVVAIEANKPQAVEAMTRAVAGRTDIVVVTVPVQYPMGSERHLCKAITGRETPAGKLTADIGVVVHNVGTARAVHQAIRFGRPLLSRVITVSGGALVSGHNIDVPLGTLVSDLITWCGGFTDGKVPHRLISGGPMMGHPLPALDVPVIKGTSGILALTRDEINEQPAGPCIRCGTCVSVCPCGLMPLEIAAFIRRDNLDAATRSGVRDCVSCGSCSYICPSHIPLVQYFNYAKGRLNALDRERRKHERLKGLVEARRARMDKLARAKRDAAARARTAPPAAPPMAPPTAETKANA